MAAFLTLFLPLAALTVVDLSQPWAEAPGYNANTAATTLAAAVNSNTRSYLLLKGGKKVAEYYRPDVSETDTSLMWSTTKSWSSLLIGILVDAGSVSVTSTLETIFPATTNWAAVTDQAAKKAIKLEDLLTMTSGLKDPFFFLACPRKTRWSKSSTTAPTTRAKSAPSSTSPRPIFWRMSSNRRQAASSRRRMRWARAASSPRWASRVDPFRGGRIFYFMSLTIGKASQAAP